MKLILSLSLALGFLNTEAQTSVKSIGLVGDGKADASVALQKAVDEGKTDLYFSKGRYRITKTIRIDLDQTGPCSFSGDGTATLIMEGAGPALHFVGTHGGTAAPDTVKPNIWEKQRTPMVEGIEIIGTHAEADGVEATGTMQITLSRLVVRDCRHAVHLTDRNRNVLIADCHFYHNRGIGVFYDNVNLHQSNIVGSHISYNGGGGVVSHGGNVRNLHIGTCDIEGNHAKEGPPSANIWLDSTGGSIGEVAITGCTIQHTSKSTDSANIRINGAGEDPSLERKQGRGTTREGNITIGDNVLSDVRVNIDVQNARGVTITGNTFWEGFEHDLRVLDSSHIVVTGNNFDRNPRYLVNGFENAEKNGLTFQGCSDCVLSGNLISGVTQKSAAVEIVDGYRFNITNNSILDSDGVGLLLKNLKASLVSDNLIRDDRPTDQRSKEPSLKIVGGTDNLIGSNLKGNQ